MRHWIFSIETMLKDYRMRGDIFTTREQLEMAYGVYDGHKVRFIYDSNRAVVLGTRVEVHRDWCKEVE